MRLYELLLVVCGLGLMLGTLGLSFTLPAFLYALTVVGLLLVLVGGLPPLARRWRG